MFFINPFIYGGAGGDFESIATVTVGSGGASEAVFDNIPSTFQHLQLRLVARSTRSANTDSIILQYNTDTSSANYVQYHLLEGNGTSASAAASAAGVAAKNYVADATAASVTASVFAAAVVDLLDYASTSKNKTVRSFQGNDRNGAGAVGLWSSLWINTAAITKITVKPNVGPNFVEHSTFALYGIKAP